MRCVLGTLAALLLPVTALAGPTRISWLELTAPDGALGDAFGRSVAVSGNTLVVGANGDDERGQDAGAAYVYQRAPGGRWTLQQKLLPAGLLAGDFFGWSVDVDGDVLVVGAPGDHRDVSGQPLASNTNRGAAYVFLSIDGRWVQQVRLQPAAILPNDFFGWSVAVSGVHLLVSAPLHGYPPVPGPTPWVSGSTQSLWPYTRSPHGWDEHPPVNTPSREGASLDLEGAVAVGASDWGGWRYLNPVGDWIPQALSCGPSGTRDGVAEGAVLATPVCLVSQGPDLLLCDIDYTASTHRLRRVEPDGRVTTLGPLPYDTRELAIDGTGTIWLRVEKPDLVSAFGWLGPDGRFHHVADVPISAGPNRVAGGAGAEVFIAHYCHLDRLTADGALSPLAGGTGYPCGHEDGSGAEARFDYIVDIELSGDGTALYVAEWNAIRRVDLATGVVSTVLRGGCPNGPVDGPPDVATVCSVGRIAAEPAGGLWMIDSYKLRRLAPDGTVTTVADVFDTPPPPLAAAFGTAALARNGGVWLAGPNRQTMQMVGWPTTWPPGLPVDGGVWKAAMRGNRAVVTAPRTDATVHGGGGACVYEWDVAQLGAVPAQLALARSVRPNTHLGSAVTLTDRDDLVMGPSNGCVWCGPNVCADEFDNGEVVDPVRLYRSGDGRWTEHASLPIPPSLRPRSGYGSALASAGNWLAVGAPEWNHRPQEPPPSGEIYGPGRVILYDLATLDSDGDSMPDEWERSFGLDPASAADSDLDPDEDGLTNAQEFAAHSHPHGDPGLTRYFAEGATSDFFETEIAIANPGDVTATVNLGFMTRTGDGTSRAVTVPSRQCRTVRVGGMAPAEFSTAVESDQPVVADRLMWWDRDAAYGSHGERALVSPAPTWYLAEGATHSGFDLFYLLHKPNTVDARVRVQFLRPAAPPLEKTYTVAAQSRFNIWVNQELFGDQGPALSATDVSAVIDSLEAVPIVVERAMYLTRPGGPGFEAGHESAGAIAPQRTWFFAEGATGEFFDLFVLLANPFPSSAEVEGRFLLADGQTFTKTYRLAPQSRFTVWVDQETFAGIAGRPLANVEALSTTWTVWGAHPGIVAERAMWWPGPTAATWTEAHGSPGATTTALAWAAAAGRLGDAPRTDTYYLLANTTEQDAVVRVTLLLDDESPIPAETIAVPPLSRVNVDVRTAFPEALGHRFGALFESQPVEPTGQPVPIVVEWAVYNDARGITWAAGANALATPLPSAQQALPGKP